MITWQLCMLLCGIFLVLVFKLQHEWSEKWSEMQFGGGEVEGGGGHSAGSAHLSLRWSMSVCLTLRPDRVPHCLPKLPSGELVQVNTSPASFFSVYWYWGGQNFLVKSLRLQTSLIVIIYYTDYLKVPYSTYFQVFVFFILHSSFAPLCIQKPALISRKQHT